jgi:hypothetical protein
VAPKSPTVTADDDVAEAREAYEAASEAFADNYADALEDFKFSRLSQQWPPQIERQRQLDQRPCLTINRLPTFIRQVVNDARQNKPEIDVHPVDSYSDPETAQILNGLIRHIEQTSDADVAYDTALEHAVTGGFGYFGVNTRYANDDDFTQDIALEAKPNCFAILGDPASTAADSSDWNSAFELSAYTEDAFKARWKGAEAVSFEGNGVKLTPVHDGENVTLATQWLRERSLRQIVAVSAPDLDAPEDAIYQALPFLTDNLILDLKVYEANKELFDAIGVRVLGQPREVPSFKVTQKLLSGAEVLETNAWAGKFIPIIPVYGEDINIEGKRHFRSLVRDAKDPQRMFNYWRTTSTELVALAPKAPWVGPVGSFVTDGEKWATANTETHAYIEYDIVGENGNPIPPPQRQPFAGVPAGAIQEALNAGDDMKSIMGLFDASLGARSNETSGKAILMRQREGDVSSFHFIDNLSRSIRHTGRVILDLIPTVYSTSRMVRILGRDGAAKMVQCGPTGQSPQPIVANTPAPQPMPGQSPMGSPGAPPAPQGQGEGSPLDEAEDLAKVYDLTLGKYDVVVTAGPSYTTQREQAADQMLELIRSYPAAAPFVLDLLAENLDWPGADQIADRARKMLPAVLQGQNPEVEQLKAQAQATISQLSQALGAAKAKIVEMEMDHSVAADKNAIAAYDAETKRLAAFVGKNGAPYDAATVQGPIAQAMIHILSNPDIIEGAMNGGDPQQLMTALMSRLPQPTNDPSQGGAPPMAA